MAVFDSFFAGGFECSSQRRHDGRRLDLLAATAHDRHAHADYAAMRAHGMRTVRDGLRWHLIEQPDGSYDWSSFLPMLQAAQAMGVQPIWDLCHYGWPDHIDIWSSAFVDRFAAFSAAAARLVKTHSDAVPLYCPINELSFWPWAATELGLMHPLTPGRGQALKVQLVRACIASIHAVRAVDPRVRFMQADPVIRVAAREPHEEAAAQGRSQAVFDAWQMLTGRLAPELGGDPSCLDVVGINYYAHNQWFLDNETIPRQHPRYRPFRELLAQVHQLLARPLYIAETGTEGADRAAWLRYVCDEVAAAREAGVPVEGICLYPVLDYPGWADERHCDTGLLGHADATGRRPVYEPLDEELARQQARFGEPRDGGGGRQAPEG